MQNHRIGFLKNVQARRCTFAGELNASPADFLDVTRKDPTAERLRHQLAPKADSQSRQLSDSRCSIRAVSDFRNG